MLPDALTTGGPGKGRRGESLLAKLRVERPSRVRFTGIKLAIQLAGFRNVEAGMGQPILVIHKLHRASHTVGTIVPSRAMLPSEAMDEAGKAFLANGRGEFGTK